jgi:uncharacterized membrane protein
VISSLLLLATLLFSYAITAVSNAQSPTIAPSVESTLTPTFGITPAATILTINPGATQTVSLTLYSIDRYNGTVTLSATSPSGITSHIATSTLTVKYGQSERITISLSVSSQTREGNYTVTITGHDGSLSHSVNVTLRVVHPYFLIQPSSDYPSISYQSSETYKIQVTSVNMFSGSVTLKAQATDFSCTFGPSTITLSSGQSKNTTLALSVHSNLKEGGYPIFITGTDDHGLTHTYSFTVEVIKPDFTMSASTCTIHGKNADFIINLRSIDRLNGTISFSSCHPVGWNAPVFCPSNVTIDYQHNYKTASVTIPVPSGVASGKYTISITGYCHGISHTIPVSVYVSNT